MDFFIFCYLMKIQTTKDELEEMKKEQDSLIAIFSEDRDRRDKEEEDLRNKLEVQNQLYSLKTFMKMEMSYNFVVAGGVENDRSVVRWKSSREIKRWTEALEVGN